MPKEDRWKKFVGVLEFMIVATLVLRLFFAYEWVNSGLGKINSITTDAVAYFNSMAPVITTVWTVGGGSTKANPYPFMADFLKNTVGPNIGTFLTLTAIAEFSVGVCYILGFLVRPASIVGMFLNAMFFLAAGHTSPSTASVNLMMFGGQLFMFLVSAGRAYGLDAVLSSKFPKIKLF